MVKINFAKVKENAIIPTKRQEDAGYDIYACFEDDYRVIPPHTTVMIPTGIASAFDSDYCFILKERGSTGTKGIAQRSGVIDSGYRNEWLVPLTNTTNSILIISKIEAEELFKVIENTNIFNLEDKKDFFVYPYSKAIAQALLIPVPVTEIEEIDYKTLSQISSERGMGKLGSSGK